MEGQVLKPNRRSVRMGSSPFERQTDRLSVWDGLLLKINRKSVRMNEVFVKTDKNLVIFLPDFGVLER